MPIFDLPVESRDKLGTAHARRYRRAGRVPCILYGRGRESVPLITPASAVEHLLKHHTPLVRLTLGEKSQTALVRALEWDTFGEHVAHLDFVRVEMEDEVKVSIPVHVTGDPKGAHEGGSLQLVKPDLEVYCRVDSIPEQVTLDVSDLGIGDGIYVDEVPYPDRVRPVREGHELVVHVLAPKKVVEEEPSVEEGEPGAEGAPEAAPETPASK